LFRDYIDALPEPCLDKVVRVHSDEVFDKKGGYSTAVQRVMAHSGYPVHGKAHSLVGV
jgi:hypothetical protein